MLDSPCDIAIAARILSLRNIGRLNPGASTGQLLAMLLVGLGRLLVSTMLLGRWRILLLLLLPILLGRRRIVLLLLLLIVALLAICCAH